MKIQILGTGCPKCRQLYDNVQKAAEELNLDCSISKVEKLGEIAEMGVMITPALAVDDRVVSSGRVLSPEQIAKILSTVE